jgi:hypothetical protein
MNTDFRADLPQWTEGVCGDGAAILRDGVMVPIEEVIARLNQAEARAALAAPEQGPTVMKIVELADQIEDEGLGQVDLVRRALTRWGRPAVEPVPVAERLPGPEDCDDQGRCWWLDRPLKNGPAHWMLRRQDDGLLIPFIAWAPHWAIPVPQEGADG